MQATFAPRAGCALLLICALSAAAPAAAAQLIDATDHAELEASISATAVNRIAVLGDRIARVIRSPGGFETEHDPASGDLYLKPVDPDAADGGPVTLFIGTEKGFTYRLALVATERGSAQILIRNPAVAAMPEVGDPGDTHVAALVRLVRAVARREPLADYAIAGARPAPVRDRDPAPAIAAVEIWRGPRFDAHVVETKGIGDAAALAARFEGAAAAWLAAPGPGAGADSLRLAVVVIERSDAGTAP